MAGTIVRERCVVLMGKSGAGKSSVANAIVGHDMLSGKSPPFGVSTEVLQSVTREVKHEMVEFTRGGILYRVTVIDTVGLFDTKLKGQDPIFKKIEEFFKKHIAAINLIIFVFKKGRFTQEEKEVFSFIRRKVHKEISPISALAITGCENDNKDARQKLIREFNSDSESKEIANQMEMGIQPVGFPPLDTWDSALHRHYQSKMVADREVLRDLIVRAESMHVTKELFESKLRRLCTIL